MSIVASVRSTLVPIHREGLVFVAAGIVATLLLAWLWRPLLWPCGAIVLWIVYFFRDPPRVTPVADDLVVAPADGRVSQIAQAAPPAELGLPAVPLTRVSVFMSVFDCHINRAPLAGRIERIAYRPGLFLSADLDKASEDNERNALVVATPHGTICIVQIAGLVARRIKSFVGEGETLSAGERFGIIRFGSRVDVYLPPAFRVLVGEGQRMIAGETVIADISQARPPAFRTA